STPTQSTQPTPQPTPQPTVTVLTGAGGAAAIGVLPTSASTFVAPADTAGQFLLTRIVALLAQGATVDQLNAAARAVGATRIVTSANGAPLLTLEVPRQTNAAALIKLAATLQAQPGIALAFAAETQESTVLPATSTGAP